MHICVNIGKSVRVNRNEVGTKIHPQIPGHVGVAIVEVEHLPGLL